MRYTNDCPPDRKFTKKDCETASPNTLNNPEDKSNKPPGCYWSNNVWYWNDKSNSTAEFGKVDNDATKTYWCLCKSNN